MMKDNKIIDFLLWARNDEVHFREFTSIREIHYFLLGYQASESDNSVKNGVGGWVSDFMDFCEKRKNSIFSNKVECPSGLSYYLFIVEHQESEAEGQKVFYQLLIDFLSTYNNM
ncbi:hypothetical protein QWY85_14920 [Neolewinella lacunae]|uniref:Uncharacterized protein n=1 Tax=Neolewinella lacunae TaxID=1517758 RepID=A0A923PEQ2_9BACT|nr:hypothetical protein [Neolewinella lacunae]MBC6992715.1 hypothetical protein [Neolewinella lacunae]MDN3635959.1 hypothetical protein [Neolewinella lacunae]